MKFSFNVHLTDEDYYEFNKFQVIDSPFGKKQILKIRVIIAVAVAVFAFVSLLTGGFNKESVIGLIPFLLVGIIFIVTTPKTFANSLKRQLKSMKKHGKQGYSPESVIEFYDDRLVEITSENKTEHKYTAVENVFVVGGRFVYIFVNNIMAYIVPCSAFESTAQYKDFLVFLESKCTDVKYF